MTQAMKTANDSNDIDRIETLNDIYYSLSNLLENFQSFKAWVHVRAIFYSFMDNKIHRRIFQRGSSSW